MQVLFGAHYSDECSKYQTITDRKKKIKEVVLDASEKGIWRKTAREIKHVCTVVKIINITGACVQKDLLVLQSVSSLLLP